MMLFKKAENTMAYLKMGVMGEAGSGKTHTSTLVAIGLVKYLRERGIPGADRPAFMLDTENGSSWIKPMFEEAGIELQVAKTRAFKDLVPAVREAEANASILLIDSVTHFWEELKDSYLAVLSERRKRPVTDLEFQDWAYIKGQWKKFSDAFVISNLHCVLCGRLGWEYEQTTNDRGKKQIEKSAVKMQAEKGLGYEPNILVWMERNMDLASKVTMRSATILKDRSRRLDGKEFEQPTFTTFLPHIEFMALGGRHESIDVSRTSDDMMPDTDEGKRDTTAIRREIEIEEIQATFADAIPGKTADDQKRKRELLTACFGTRSWTEIEKLMPLKDLRDGHKKLRTALDSSGGQPPEQAETPATPAVATEDAVEVDQPSQMAAAREPAEPDYRDTILRDLKAIIDKTHNATRLAQVWKAFEVDSLPIMDEPRRQLAMAHYIGAKKRIAALKAA